ncbi:Murein DD-endopeptidase MepS/Murein LD-carboxypeptidase [Acaryochloris thomasi RCC1774]|uniref:Murein DD-endopeptidase MepS/Murein LD-carboxypeptidase n=1 Tax=Acaryochloris thomasi RCC1774 TaxID=1764569 RepID=A0A2W1JFB8_9CYAN|nr:C40 family peptidase [Acaryochloris thomasi]PZD72308.1 Murein DD-endopeptidase MepS/Murein LD-carboxypeptidase [Acaryochloris thomasi RCC1774]
MAQPSLEYQTQVHLNLYDSPELKALATQALQGRHLRQVEEGQTEAAIQVCLCEDGYSGWISVADLESIQPTTTPYVAPVVTAAQVQERIGDAIAFTKSALSVPNIYLWGGTLGPNYDCSGLMQRAYGEQGIWLPRDSYQQQDFTETIAEPGSDPEDCLNHLQPGDLIFFGKPEKTDHVAMYIGDGEYIHSSGHEKGRNTIAIDRLDEGDLVRKTYYQQFRGAGRVVSSYRL